ncbi:hypothetical protein L3X38_015074 [Prunus dulcis]|uniref:Uncharacterized protein n=1 Tax=Prunus dulcis TaxID=3755 RepID=A0AAD4WPH4_PRUDU|nr:hypothetical protein L3X38_015074 [Prunus dulcis]
MFGLIPPSSFCHGRKVQEHADCLTVPEEHHSWRPYKKLAHDRFCKQGEKVQLQSIKNILDSYVSEYHSQLTGTL